MKITVQLVVCDDDDHKETLTDVVVLEKACQRIEQVGLTLAEAKVLLSALQQQIVERQAATFLAMCRHCQRIQWFISAAVVLSLSKNLIER